MRKRHPLRPARPPWADGNQAQSGPGGRGSLDFLARGAASALRHVRAATLAVVLALAAVNAVLAAEQPTTPPREPDVLTEPPAAATDEPAPPAGQPAPAQPPAPEPAPPSCEATLAAATDAMFAEVVDPRALRLADGRVLRLAGIEPPGILVADAAAPEDRLVRRLRTLATSGPLRYAALSEKPDRYGRQPALVVVGDLLLQAELAREALALAYATGPALPCFDRILDAEAESRLAGRGFWNGWRMPPAAPAALVGAVGRFAIFEGRIRSVGNRSATTYLNFGGRWLSDVTAEIAAGDRESFGGEAALSALAGQRVRLRGFLVEKSGPMLPLVSPLQLEQLDAGSNPPLQP